MIHVYDLPDSAAQSAIDTGEFPTSLTSHDHVAIVMTQSWCVEWLHMKSWLSRLEKKGKPEDREIHVYVLVYDKVGYFQRFMEHKESVFGNSLIPYVRYYSRGTFLGDSNYVHRGAFLDQFPA